MIKIRQTILLSLVFLSLTCCVKTTSGGREAKVITISADDCERVSMNDLFSRIEVIILEGDSIESCLSQPEEISYHNGSYYIKDRQAVYVYDSIGNFKYSTASRFGRGHNEYFSANGYYIDNGIVYIMDWNGIIRGYDSYLNTTETISVKTDGVGYYDGVARLSDDILVLSNENSHTETILWSFYSKSKEKVVRTVRINNDATRDNVYFGRHYLSNDSILLYRPFDNEYSLYRVDPGILSVYEAIRYDVGKNALDRSLAGNSESVASHIVKNYQNLSLLMDIGINNKFIISRIGCVPMQGFQNSEIRLSVYSLKDGRNRLLDNVMTGNKWLMSIDYMDDNCIYTILNSYEGIEHLYEDSLLDDESGKNLKRINDDINAVIIRYQLKEDLI